MLIHLCMHLIFIRCLCKGQRFHSHVDEATYKGPRGRQLSASRSIWRKDLLDEVDDARSVIGSNVFSLTLLVIIHVEHTPIITYQCIMTSRSNTTSRQYDDVRT